VSVAFQRDPFFDKRRHFVLDTVSQSSIIYILRESESLSPLMGYGDSPEDRMPSHKDS
jgi:hypothetical protein